LSLLFNDILWLVLFELPVQTDCTHRRWWWNTTDVLSQYQCQSASPSFTVRLCAG